MTTRLAVSAHRRADSRNDGDLAATVLIIDGRRETWRARGLSHDPDVTAWTVGAINDDHPDYASLWWRDLLAMRASRN